MGSVLTTNAAKLSKLRQVITESLRVQRDGDPIEYINVGTARDDACARQNHAIFARRGCGKTLLLHDSASHLRPDSAAIYLNCEDFKQHSFPNVLIEILSALFREVKKNLPGWFGRRKKTREMVEGILEKLAALQKSADEQQEKVRRLNVDENESQLDFDAGAKSDALSLNFKTKDRQAQKVEVERSFDVHKKKLQELDRWLPELKEQVRDAIGASNKVKTIFIQIDDLYHLRRTDQAFVVDYIHRLCKDLPLYFKIATLRHASTLYADRDGQPIGAQERHDYQPINIDYTFGDFQKTRSQNLEIIYKFGTKAGVSKAEVDGLFKGEGFSRLVMAGGGVPRDVLSLFLEVLSDLDIVGGSRIGKDEVRILSKQNFERRIEELKQDSQGEEQDDLIKGIYIIRTFCLDKKTNLFLVEERMLQQNDEWRALFYRLLDYRIIHSCATALTHKSQDGTYQAYAIDIGCYAHLRKLEGRFNEIDVASPGVKEKMRSAPILDADKLSSLFKAVPENAEAALLQDDLEAA